MCQIEFIWNCVLVFDLLFLTFLLICLSTIKLHHIIIYYENTNCCQGVEHKIICLKCSAVKKCLNVFFFFHINQLKSARNKKITKCDLKCKHWCFQSNFSETKKGVVQSYCISFLFCEWTRPSWRSQRKSANQSIQEMSQRYQDGRLRGSPNAKM